MREFTHGKRCKKTENKHQVMGKFVSVSSLTLGKPFSVHPSGGSFQMSSEMRRLSLAFVIRSTATVLFSSGFPTGIASLRAYVPN